MNKIFEVFIPFLEKFYLFLVAIELSIAIDNIKNDANDPHINGLLTKKNFLAGKKPFNRVYENYGKRTNGYQ